MAIRIILPSSEDTVRYHARRGWQCPECFGIQVTIRRNKFVARIDGFQCDECGCQWGEDY